MTIPTDVRNSGDWIATNVGLAIPDFEAYLSKATGLKYTTLAPVVTDTSASWTFLAEKNPKDMGVNFSLQITYNPDSTAYDSVARQLDSDGKVVREVPVPDLYAEMLTDPSLWFSWVGKVVPTEVREEPAARPDPLVTLLEGLFQ